MEDHVVHGGPRPPSFSLSRFMCTKCTDQHRGCSLLPCFSRRYYAGDEFPRLAPGGGLEQLLVALRPCSFSKITTVGSRRRIGISREGLHGSGGSAALTGGGEATTAATRIDSPSSYYTAAFASSQRDSMVSSC
jgi:hypothetical protein